MKYPRRRLPIPQNEFGFVTETFNLMMETTLDGDRVTRERAEIELARRNAGSQQEGLPVVKPRVSRKRRYQRTPKRTPKRLKLIKPNSGE